MIAKRFIFLFLLGASSSSATVTIDFQIGELFSAESNPAPIGSFGLIVADKNRDGFLGDYLTGSEDFDAFSGTTLSVGSLLGGSGDDEIIISETLSTDLGFPGINGEQPSIVLDDGLDGGDPLGLYWFPEITSPNISGSVAQYGFYRSDSVQSGSDIAFLMPSDGANVLLSAFSDNVNPQSAITTADFTAIPEPSAYATILGLLGLGYAVFCRRRRSSSQD